jgi:two-component system, LuxR family, sensor kinase FixL
VLMDRALVLSRGAFAMRGVDVVCEFNCSASIAVDCNKVLQILLNLFANARHAVGDRAQHDRRVWLGTSMVGGRVRMEVRDNGVGIEERHLPQMFNQGFTTKSDGHGIGLHSSANWAHELGGTLTCHSEGIGEGATFILELAVAAQQPASNDAVSIAS